MIDERRTASPPPGLGSAPLSPETAPPTRRDERPHLPGQPAIERHGCDPAHPHATISAHQTARTRRTPPDQAARKIEANARIVERENSDNPFLTLPEAFVKDYLNSYQRYEASEVVEQ